MFDRAEYLAEESLRDYFESERNKGNKKHMSIITVVNVDITTPAGKKYSCAEVVYKSEYNGKQDVKTKKIMSFANPSIYAIAKDAKQGEVYEITQEKVGEFWNWTSMVKSDGSSTAQSASNAAPAAPGRTAASSSGRDFESKDERAERQRLIVRQSAVNYAIAMLSPGTKAALDKATVFSLAEAVVAFVTQAPSLIEMTNDSLDDLPY